MKNKKLIIAIACIIIIALTVALGLFMRAQQTANEAKGGITLNVNGKTIVVSLDKLNQVAFEGETVNGKGDRSTHAYRGVELKTLLASNSVDVAKVTAVTASSADQYTAELTGDEIRDDDRVYVAIELDGKPVDGIDEGTRGAQMVVFGDQNSRRNVRFLSVIEVK